MYIGYTNAIADWHALLADLLAQTEEGEQNGEASNK